MTDTTTWRDCRHCRARIRPSTLGAHWIDADNYDFCEDTGDTHEPADRHHSTKETVMTHPLPVGARVRSKGQQFYRAILEGTGNIIEVKGPYPDGAYEYLINHDGSFAGGPEKREPSWWASYATIAVETTA